MQRARAKQSGAASQGSMDARRPTSWHENASWSRGDTLALRPSPRLHSTLRRVSLFCESWLWSPVLVAMPCGSSQGQGPPGFWWGLGQGG